MRCVGLIVYCDSICLHEGVCVCVCVCVCARACVHACVYTCVLINIRD